MSPQRVLYIGQFRPGTTSYSRGCMLRELLQEAEFIPIDTLEPFYETPRAFRSLGFRWKAGPLINRVNDFVLGRVDGNPYDLVWVDKAVFLTDATTARLRKIAKHLVHFTPDPAFTYHRSKHFERSLKYYDTLVTTKSYEIEHYTRRADSGRLVLVTQGYDLSVHYPRKKFEQRIPGVCFIGHHEKSRQAIIEAVLQEGVPVFLAGRNWERVARRFRAYPNLIYGGPGVYGDEYAERISEYKFGLGLLSKWVPEKHTTRTFEIPSCGSILVTERNNETEKFYKEDEALFFAGTTDLLESLHYFLDNPKEAAEIARRGVQRTQSSGFDYKNIVKQVLAHVNGNPA